MRRHTAARTSAIASHSPASVAGVDVAERAIQRRVRRHRPEQVGLRTQMLDVGARLAAAGVTLWLIGVLLVLARLAFGTARVWWMARRAMPATVWAPLGDHLAQSLGIERPVTFLSRRRGCDADGVGADARARAAAGRSR